MTEDRYLELKELAEYTSLSVPTLRRFLPEIPHVSIGRKTLVRRSDFDWWARRRQRRHAQVSPLVRRLVDEFLRKVG